MPYIEPTRQQVEALQARGIEGPVEMLNLLRFREVADSRLLPMEPTDRVVPAERT